jgi:multiple sugar transport system substrate-binding protein
MIKRLFFCITACLVLGTASAQSLVFLSTQLVPIEEAEAMRRQILADFPKSVEFIPEAAGPFIDRLLAEARAGRGTVDLIGTLHGDFPQLVGANAVQRVTELATALADRGFTQVFMELGRLGTETQYYIPWMQATYIMAAHRQALAYLPEGADLNRLTYAQLTEWAANIQEATGSRMLGFPAGPGGLMHRFFQGYLYPSFTGSVVREFRSEAAAEMWQAFRDLWRHVHPSSTVYSFMQEPLLAGEVWIAWDHTARLLDALRQRPDEFVAFPAPAGPQGRGFMPVLTGLGIPATAPNPEGAAELIAYLTRPEVQVSVLQAGIGFFPVVEVELPEDLPEGVRIAGDAIRQQEGAEDALASLLPVGLGGLGGEFNKVFLDTFTRIILRGENIRQVLDAEAENLRRVINEAGAPCWPPDEPSVGPCPVN